MLAKLGLLAMTTFAVYLAFGGSSSFTPDMVRGKRVLITGASSGIGEQLAYQYARHGASVFVTARREKLLQQVIERCRDVGESKATFGYVSADMSNMANTELVVRNAADTLGGLDHVILNHANILKPKYWDATTANLNNVDKAMTVNALSFMHLTAHALPYLEKTEGHLSVVSSLLGKVAMSGFAPYAASKFALDGFFSSLRYELKPRNISVTLSVLGYIGTDAMQSFVMPSIFSKFMVDPSEVNRTYPPADPAECAYEILRGTTMRETEVYFPPAQYIRFIVYIRDIINRFQLMVKLKPRTSVL